MLTTIFPLLSIILTGLILIKEQYNYLPVANNIPLEHIKSMKLGLLGIWLLSVVILTTSTDYIYLSTGYVAIWLGFLSSLNLLAYTNEQINQVEDISQRYYSKSSIIFQIALLSTLVFTSGVLSCVMLPSSSGMCNGKAMFSMLLAFISAAATLWLLVSDYTLSIVNVNSGSDDIEQKAFLRHSSLALLIFWFIFVIFCTTTEPYYHREQGSVVANIFLPSWVCLILSVFFYQGQQEKELLQEQDNNRMYV